MNLYELNSVPNCGQSSGVPSPTVQQMPTTFLTTHLPLAVESFTKTTKHASATVSRRVFGPNDCIVMTTWLEKFTYSTIKTTAVGKPVVSDSVEVPMNILQATCCPPTELPPEPSTQKSSSCQTTLESETDCLSSDLKDTLTEMAEESENEISTDSEHEMCTDSEDEDEFTSSDDIIFQ